MLSGDNGILKKATDAKTNTERISVIELAQTDILGQIAKNEGKNISETQLKTILGKYFEDFDDELPSDLSGTTIKLKAKEEYGGYKDIALSDIYDGILAKEDELTDLERLNLYFNDINSFDNEGSLIDNNALGIKVSDLQIIDFDSGIFKYNEGFYKNVWSYDEDKGIKICNVEESNYLVSEFNYNGADPVVCLIDRKTNKKTTFEDMYIIINGSKINIMDIVVIDEENCNILHARNLSGLNGFYFPSTYEFIILKGGKEYKGALYLSYAI